MRDLAIALANATLAMPAVEVTGDQPAPFRDSHSYAKRAIAYLAEPISASDLAWCVAGIAICHAEAVDGQP